MHHHTVAITSSSSVNITIKNTVGFTRKDKF